VSLAWRILLLALAINAVTVGTVQVVVHLAQQSWFANASKELDEGVKGSFAELERSVELSPNFALGHYTLGFVRSQTGDPRSAIDATNHSRELSPFDPLQFAMLASRATCFAAFSTNAMR